MLVVDLLVSWSVTRVHHAYTAERIDMPLGIGVGLGPSDNVLGGGPDPPREGGSYVGEGLPPSSCKKSTVY